MNLAKYFLLIIVALPLSANEADDEIIKNLDFFQNIEIVKEDNLYFTQSSNIINTINDQFIFEQEATQINSFPDSEKK